MPRIYNHIQATRSSQSSQARKSRKTSQHSDEYHRHHPPPARHPHRSRMSYPILRGFILARGIWIWNLYIIRRLIRCLRRGRGGVQVFRLKYPRATVSDYEGHWMGISSRMLACPCLAGRSSRVSRTASSSTRRLWLSTPDLRLGTHPIRREEVVRRVEVIWIDVYVP